jgi:hypothetical protein
MEANYWAAVGKDELPGKVTEKVEAYYQNLHTDGRIDLWRNAYRHYYGLDSNWRHVSAKPVRDGDQGELIKVKASHAANLAQHLVNLTAQSRPSFECRAINTDYKSQAECILGQQILEFYMRERKLGQIFRLADEYGVTMSEAYAVVDWDQERGETFMVHPETGRPIKGGDVDIRVFLPVDVIREFHQDEDSKPDWYIIRRRMNRHKLAAMYPEFADKILNMGDDKPGFQVDDLHDFQAKGDDDRLTVFTLYHDRCPQMPDGLKAIIVDDHCVEHGKFPFKKFNVHRVAPRLQFKTPYGYTAYFDLLGLEDVIDSLLSAVVSNNNNHAIQNVWTKPGAQLSVRQLAGGMNHLESVDKPEPIQLTQSAPETYNLIKLFETLAETISGVNSVARGNPEGGLKGASGSALALLQSMTIQFASGLQDAHAQMVENVGDSIIDVLQTKAEVPRIAMIAGKTNRAYAKEFSRKDIASISRVVVDMGNPAARTAAGRLQIADNLLQAGLVKRPEQYIEVLSTGKLEPMIEAEQAELLLIKSENDNLKDGKGASALISDNHPMHFKEHNAILADPETRGQPEIVQSVLAHMQEHITLWQEMNPEMLQLLGLPVPPMAGPPPPQPGQPQVQPTGIGEQMAEPQGGPQNMPPEMAQQMPSMPVDPMSGQQVQAPQ